MPAEAHRSPAPLADRLRPQSLDQIEGQEHLTGPDGPLRSFFERGQIPSVILWGPPGSGKTTLARVLGSHPGYELEHFSAVLSGVKEIREAVERARRRRQDRGRKTLLFVDELHRFNRSQQDALLPHVEAGLLTLIGATTENPSFEVNAALLSRCALYVLKPLSRESLRRVGERALADPDRGLGPNAPELNAEAWEAALRYADGDARRLLNLLEAVASPASSISDSREEGEPRSTAPRSPASPQPSRRRIDRSEIERILQRGLPTRHGDEDHFDWISALHKSLRGSDPHAGLYWLARMLEAGEEPRYVARRLIRFASEDVGLAEPGVLVQAVAAKDAVEFVGPPECFLALAQIVVLLALAPKSDSLTTGYSRAASLVRERGALPVPLRIRNAPTQMMVDLGYGQGYRYPHSEAGRFVAESYLPEALAEEILYRPSNQGKESRMVEDHRHRTQDFYRLRTDEPEDRPDVP